MAVPYYKRPRGRGVFGFDRTSSLVLFGPVALRLHLGHHLADEVVLFLLDACAHFVAHELDHLRTRLLQKFLDRDLRILDERLAVEGDLRQELAQPALDHLGDDVGRLLLTLGLLGEDLALLVDDRGVTAPVSATRAPIRVP
jgi:hypothetical protein